MKTVFQTFIYIILSFFAVVTIILLIVYFNNNPKNLTLNIPAFTTIAVALICFCLIVFFVYVSLKSNKDDPYPLGLPTGSVRALIALLVLIFFVLISIIFTFSLNPLDQTDLIKDIIKTLGTLLIAVSAFYFGSKATEQGSEIANKNFDSGVQSQKKNDSDTNADGDVPIEIIEEALKTDNNRENWKNLYKCIDITAGKKQTQNTTHNLNCLIFKVITKEHPEGGQSIPPTITYNSKGKNYTIPTDVQFAGEEAKTDPAANNIKAGNGEDGQKADSKKDNIDPNPEEINDEGSEQQDLIKG